MNPENSVRAAFLLEWLKNVQVDERNEALETGRHFTGAEGNTVFVLSERIDGTYFLDGVTVE